MHRPIDTRNNTPPHAYLDPWALPVSERIRLLRKGTHRVAYFYHLADNSTFRYRVYNPCQVINELSQDVSASYFFIADSLHFDTIASLADQLVICRTPYCREVNNIVARFKAAGKRVSFDIDDLVFDPRHAQLVADTIGQDIETEEHLNAWYGYVARQYTTMQLCDDYVTTNEFLAEQIRSFTGRPTRVLRNFMNREQLEYSQKVHGHRSHEAGSSETFRVGYFSGSPSHAQDFAVASSALLKLMTQDERIELVIAGYIEPPGDSKELRHRIHKIPFTDFINLQRELSNVDLNIVPLQYNTFTNCKSELKYFEAAAVGTPSAASPIYSYAHSIRHAETGFLIRSHEWETALADIIRDRDRLSQISRAARKDALQSYNWENMLADTLDSLGCHAEVLLGDRCDRQQDKA